MATKKSTDGGAKKRAAPKKAEAAAKKAAPKRAIAKPGAGAMRAPAKSRKKTIRAPKMQVFKDGKQITPEGPEDTFNCPADCRSLHVINNGVRAAPKLLTIVL